LADVENRPRQAPFRHLSARGAFAGSRNLVIFAVVNTASNVFRVLHITGALLVGDARQSDSAVRLVSQKSNSTVSPRRKNQDRMCNALPTFHLYTSQQTSLFVIFSVVSHRQLWRVNTNCHARLQRSLRGPAALLFLEILPVFLRESALQSLEIAPNPNMTICVNTP